MTQEDLDQIRALISANNEVLFAAMRAIEEHVDRSISELRDEFGKRFDHLERRLEQVERRLDRLDTRFGVFEFQMAGIGKSLTAGEKLDSEFTATQIAQQRAIDDLARRITKIEQRLNQ
jgi:predicted  nucleic acid-binding Zn-ribbon protein